MIHRSVRSSTISKGQRKGETSGLGAKQQRTAVLLSPEVWAYALQSGSRHNLGQLPFKYKGVEGQGGARSRPRSHGS